MGIVKIGGSIGNGVLLLVAAWAAHVFTRRVQGSPKPAAESKSKQLRTRFFAMLAEPSFKLLVRDLGKTTRTSATCIGAYCSCPLPSSNGSGRAAHANSDNEHAL